MVGYWRRNSQGLFIGQGSIRMGDTRRSSARLYVDAPPHIAITRMELGIEEHETRQRDRLELAGICQCCKGTGVTPTPEPAKESP